MSDMPTSEAEWEAHQAFYRHTVAQRDAAWREVEELRVMLNGSDARTEYALVFDPAHEVDLPMMWTGTVWDRWPENDPDAGGKGPWGIPRINKHPVKVVKRIVITTRWVDAPNPEPPYNQTGDQT